MHDELRIFAGSSNPGFATAICSHLGIPLSLLDISRFSNDNLSIQVLENVRERDVFVVQSFTEPVSEHIVELFIILDALRSASARRVTAIIPYFSYARSDKKDAPRISITGRLMADLIRTAGADRVLTMDLHSDQVHGFFSIPVDHLTAIPTIAEHLRQVMPLERAVAVSTDAGAAKRVGKIAEWLNIPMAIIDKRRVSDLQVKHGLVVGDVTDRDAIIYDDEIAAASTVVSTAEILQAAGARSIGAAATHGVFCGPAVERLRSAPLQRVIVSDTVASPAVGQLANLTVLSVAPLFAEAIKRIHTGESIGALFSRRKG